MTKNYVGNEGTVIILETGQDLSNALDLKIYVKKPSGTTVIWDATLGPMNPQGTYTKLQYIVQHDDFDEPGWWEIQAYIETISFIGFGETTKFQLFPQFK